MVAHCNGWGEVVVAHNGMVQLSRRLRRCLAMLVAHGNDGFQSSDQIAAAGAAELPEAGGEMPPAAGSLAPTAETGGGGA